jgi:hypothetical protein
MVVEPISRTSREVRHQSSDVSENIDDLEGRRLSRDWTPAGREALREQILAQLPRWYSPLAHVLFPALVGVGVMIACIVSVRGLRKIELLTVPLTFLLSNMLEWRAHRHLLHKRHPIMPILFERHTPMHHRLYTEQTMAISDWRELSMVLLPSFGILAILSVQLPLLGLALLCGLRNVALLFMATSMGYVLAYEWLHLSYHLPSDSFIGRRPLIRWLRRHHARHHDPRLMQRWNMNVTIPLWDWLSGTIYRPEGAGAVAPPLRSSVSRAESR